MKRSKQIRLVLVGSLSAAVLSGCEQRPAVSTANVYTNNFAVPGAGYFHAPFRGWYSLPYNHFDPQKKMYFFGGQWGPMPHESITNISSPTATAAASAQAVRTDVSRGGFGRSSHGSSWGSSGFHS